MKNLIQKVIVTTIVLYCIVGSYVVFEYTGQTIDEARSGQSPTFSWDLMTWPKFLLKKNNTILGVLNEADNEFIKHAATGEEMDVNGMPLYIKKLESLSADDIMMCSNFISKLSNKEELSEQDESYIADYSARLSLLRYDQYQTIKTYCKLLLILGQWIRHDILKALKLKESSLTLGSEANMILENLEKTKIFSKKELENMRQAPIDIYSLIKNNGAQIYNLMKLYEELDRDSNAYYDKIFSK